ncbi:unnamed protein product [Eretmochelys imbricata]
MLRRIRQRRLPPNLPATSCGPQRGRGEGALPAWDGWRPAHTIACWEYARLRARPHLARALQGQAMPAMEERDGVRLTALGIYGNSAWGVGGRCWGLLKGQRRCCIHSGWELASRPRELAWHRDAAREVLSC